MLSLIDIENGLLEPDGSARDITFTPVALSNVVLFLNEISGEFHVDNASNGEGLDVTEFLASRKFGDAFAGNSGSLHSCWTSSSSVIASMQVFVSWPEAEDAAFVELTFFPQDLVRDRFDLVRFASLVDHWCQVLSAADFFVRWENASWKQFDSAAPDVFFSRRSRPGIGAV